MLQVYNSITNSKETFKCENNTVKWYSCGPTVYDNAHLGHGSTYIAFDIVRRILQDYLHYDVVYHLNITDIDDKIIKRASELGVSFSEHAKKYETLFLQDMDKLNVLRSNIMTRVSEHVPDMINYIRNLMLKDFAYKSINGAGSVYMDVQKYVKVNKSLPSMTNMCECENYNEKSPEKKHQSDFVLWKEQKEENEPYWTSPWSNGRPGWHIECSVVSNISFGSNIDIHSGGIDLKFPHHTNEIIQSESYYYEEKEKEQEKWVNYFLHSGHLNISGLKMSKSLKNFITVNEFLSKWTSRHLRLLVLIHGWNVSFTFSEESMLEIKNKDRKIERFLSMNTNNDNYDITEFNEIRTKVHNSLLDNFDTSKVMEIFFNIIDLHSSKDSVNIHLYKYVYDILHMVGLEYHIKKNENTFIVNLIDELVLFRNNMRKIAISKIFDIKKILELCDNVRKNMTKLNVYIEDGKNTENSMWKFS